MTRPLLFFIISAVLTSCDLRPPADFWLNFEKDLIFKKVNDQGPWGGHTVIHWRTQNKDTFNSKSILKYAGENGWVLVQTYSFKKDTVIAWQEGGMPIFPLRGAGFNPTMHVHDNTYNMFPRYINSDVRVYKFKTNRISLDPGTDNSNDENGFILLNDSSTYMAVYHLWGE